MSRIESVSVCIARVPLDKPVTFATRVVTAREYCLVKVRNTDGVEGLGYCYAVNRSGRLLALAVTDLLAPLLIGQESLRVTSSNGTTAIPIAQTVVAAVMAQSRGFSHWLSAQRDARWSPIAATARPREIQGQRVLVLGTGPIGAEIGRLLGVLGFHVTGVRRDPQPVAGFSETVGFDRLDSLPPSADWIVLALPLTAATRGILNAQRLALLPEHARLANVARGELVDEAALLEALKKGRLAGGYLDVFSEELLPSHSPFWNLPNVWISPHNSAASQGHEHRVVDCFLAELDTWLRNPRSLLPDTLKVHQ